MRCSVFSPPLFFAHPLRCRLWMTSLPPKDLGRVLWRPDPNLFFLPFLGLNPLLSPREKGQFIEMDLPLSLFTRFPTAIDLLFSFTYPPLHCKGCIPAASLSTLISASRLIVCPLRPPPPPLHTLDFFPLTRNF